VMVLPVRLLRMSRRKMLQERETHVFTKICMVFLCSKDVCELLLDPRMSKRRTTQLRRSPLLSKRRWWSRRRERCYTAAELKLAFSLGRCRAVARGTFSLCSLVLAFRMCNLGVRKRLLLAWRLLASHTLFTSGKKTAQGFSIRCETKIGEFVSVACHTMVF
jgi:hypothetical protein